MLAHARNVVIFDLGGVLIDWDGAVKSRSRLANSPASSPRHPRVC
jgi:FMN phosphatase YigB (HAD superfamily)